MFLDSILVYQHISTHLHIHTHTYIYTYILRYCVKNERFCKVIIQPCEFTIFSQTDLEQKATSCVDGTLSDESFVLRGVPQGSVLGPVLFLMNIFDINEDIHYSSISSFA